MEDIEIERITAPDADIRLLIRELDDELASLYCAQQRHGLTLDAIFQPHILFFIARRDGAPLGCGGVALLDGFAEIKRMYVRKTARGQGFAEAIMWRLEAETARAGLDLLRLETGVYSGAAIGFYRRCGFAACEPFEPYRSMPPGSVVTSVFMEKPISARALRRP